MMNTFRRFPWIGVCALACSVLTWSARCFAADEAHGDGEMPPVWSVTIWAIISFVVVMAVLVKKLLPPIFAAMDKRSEEIRSALEAADRAKADAEAMIQKHEDHLAKARAEAAAIIEEGRSDAQKLRAKIEADAKKASEEMAARAQREIAQAKQTAVVELQELSAGLAIDIANALIKKNLTQDDQKNLIEERIREFSAA